MNNTAKPNPGDILHDREGIVSSGVEAHYVLLSAERVNTLCTKWEWRAALFRRCGDGWLGAMVVILWDGDIAKLERVGSLNVDGLKERA